ncbi:MAG: flagellin FliC [Bacteriovoracaceae bacterium]|jgi:flagellin|nr:flagellin FliC [Bacteriovoracaceae bacterium]
MALRIASNMAAQGVMKNLNNVSSDSEDALNRLSSGKRITKSADDAAGLAIGNKIEATVRGLRMAKRNANNGVSLIQVAEGGLGEMSNILIRLRELSVQSASDTVGSKERGMLDLEYQELVKESDRIAESTKFSGAPLLNGENESGTMDFFVGAYAGEENIIQFEADGTNARSSELGIEGSSIAEKDDAIDNLAQVDEGLDMIAGMRAKLGSIQSRLQITTRNIDSQVFNQDSARASIQDADIAEESAKLARNSVLKSAAIASMAQANNIPKAALNLI